ncbi:MAG: 30S ribosomal protein S17 [Minisyncoccia bacterium]
MRKRVEGIVISDKMKKTIVVVSEKLRKHPLYKKYYKHRTKYYVHDEKEEAKIGDKVLIEETRPISKLKRWRLVKIIEKK